MSSNGYDWLPLDVINAFEPLAEEWEVSEVARGRSGFLPQYKRKDGDPQAMPEKWVSKRHGFIARHMAQVKQNNEPLWEDGLPTRRHIALIMWAYSPTPEKLLSLDRLPV